MDGPRDDHTKWTKRKINIITIICGILKKKIIQMNLQNRNRLTDIENKLMVTKGERAGQGIDKLGVWD